MQDTAPQLRAAATRREGEFRRIVDCRTISTAIEQYRDDHGRYPPLDGNFEHLAPYLVPLYLRQMPAHDMNGEPFLVVMNGRDATVISVGRLGVAVTGGKIIRGGRFQGTAHTVN